MHEPHLPLTGVSAVLFDHDGTLVDSLDLVVAATNQVLLDCGVGRRPAAEIVASMILPTIPRMASYDRTVNRVEAVRRSAAFYRLSRIMAADRARPYPQVRSLLVALAARGLVLGVLSNNQGAVVRGILHASAIAGHFAVMWGEEDVPAPKPDPAGLLQAMRLLDLAPAQCLYVGDSGVDAAAATAAGIRSVGVTWGAHRRAEISHAGFSRIIDFPLELADIVNP